MFFSMHGFFIVFFVFVFSFAIVFQRRSFLYKFFQRRVIRSIKLLQMKDSYIFSISQISFDSMTDSEIMRLKDYLIEALKNSLSKGDYELFCEELSDDSRFIVYDFLKSVFPFKQ